MRGLERFGRKQASVFQKMSEREDFKIWKLTSKFYFIIQESGSEAVEPKTVTLYFGRWTAGIKTKWLTEAYPDSHYCMQTKIK